MKYDFESIIPRAGRDALAVDAIGSGGFAPEGPKEGFDAIPMWVADMNFPTCPAIQRAIVERVEHPCFGYFEPTKAYYDAIIHWHEKRNGVTGMKAEDIGYENGVLGCVSSAIQAFTAPGEGILVHAPTYVGFTATVRNCGRYLIHSDLRKDENGVWRMDYEDMEEKILKNHIHFAIFCNPHNPCGRVWTREEIEKAMAIYEKHDVIVVSDEIWSDIMLEGHRHTPTQSIGQDAKNRTIAVYAPSKTFNLAGLVGSYHVIYNPYLRDRVRKQAATSHYNSMNVLSMHALIGAYGEEGEEWLEELKETLSRNLRYGHDFINQNFPGVCAAMPEGTYMLLLDCREWCERTGMTMDQVLKAGWDVGVAWQDGRKFREPYGIRMNFALPFSRVQEAMDRLQKYVFHR